MSTIIFIMPKQIILFFSLSSGINIKVNAARDTKKYFYKLFGVCKFVNKCIYNEGGRKNVIIIYHHQYSSVTKLIAFFLVTSYVCKQCWILISTKNKTVTQSNATKLLSENTQNASKNKLNTRSQAVTFCHDFYRFYIPLIPQKHQAITYVKLAQ